MEAPTYQQLIQILSKAESEAGDDSGSLPTFQVTPANRSNLPLVLNGASNSPHGLQKPIQVFLYSRERQENLAARSSATNAAPMITSLTFCLAQHLNELLVGRCCHI